MPSSRARVFFRRLLAALALVGLGLLVGLGWHWQATLPVEAVAVRGNRHAPAEELRRLAAVPDSALLFRLDPALLADRVRRHPWVEEAAVTRWMTGTVSVSVRERVPATLVLDAAGRPDHYLDAAGFRMPLEKGAAYSVPLLRGWTAPYNPVQPVEDAALRELLGALAELDPATDALVSGVERGADGSYTLTTSPAPGGGAIPVALGRGGFTQKLRRLDAFWTQAVLTRPDTPVRRIDLRFDSQIITEEEQP